MARPKPTQAKSGCHTRQVKVTAGSYGYQLNQPVSERTPVGQIMLKGHWLVEAGFPVDNPVKVRVMERCLVLTVEAPKDGVKG